MYFHCPWGTSTNTAYYLSLLHRAKYAINWQSAVDYGNVPDGWGFIRAFCCSRYCNFLKFGTPTLQEFISLSDRSCEQEFPFPFTAEARAGDAAQSPSEITRYCLGRLTVLRHNGMCGLHLPQEMKMQSIDLVNILLCGKKRKLHQTVWSSINSLALQELCLCGLPALSALGGERGSC